MSFIIVCLLSIGYAQESSYSSMKQAQSENKWDELERLYLLQEKQNQPMAFDVLLMGCTAASQRGDLQLWYERLEKAVAKRSSGTHVKELQMLQKTTSITEISGQHKLILITKDLDQSLVRGVEFASQELQKNGSFKGRLPHGEYTHNSLTLSIPQNVQPSEPTANSQASDVDTQKTERKGIVPDWVPQNIQPVIEPWLLSRTTHRMRSGLHTLFFGSDNNDIAMQSAWAFGPTVGLIWYKKVDTWTLGLETNSYLSFGTNAFFFGVYGSGTASYLFSKGAISAGLRYDLAFGSVRGVKMRDITPNVTEQALEDLSVPGVALSLGLWLGYSYPIYKDISIQTRLGYRNDGKRGYFDGDIGASFKRPF